jgi:hypothetical protein
MATLAERWQAFRNPGGDAPLPEGEVVGGRVGLRPAVGKLIAAAAARVAKKAVRIARR